MRGSKSGSTHEGATPLAEGSRSQVSRFFGSFKGVGSLDTQSSSHSDERADAHASHSLQGISNVSLPHVALNIGSKAASFSFLFLAALLQALTFALAPLAISWNPGLGVLSDRGSEDTTEAKASATGCLSSRRLTFACVKPGTSAPGQTSSILISVFSSAPLGSACSPKGPVSRGPPLVDEGPVLTSSVFDLVLVTTTGLALNVTDISTVQDTRLLGVLPVLLQSSRAFLCYQKRFLDYPHLCLFLVFVKENLDDVPQCNVRSTKR